MKSATNSCTDNPTHGDPSRDLCSTSHPSKIAAKSYSRNFEQIFDNFFFAKWGPKEFPIFRPKKFFSSLKLAQNRSKTNFLNFEGAGAECLAPRAFPPVGNSAPLPLKMLQNHFFRDSEQLCEKKFFFCEMCEGKDVGAQPQLLTEFNWFF